MGILLLIGALVFMLKVGGAERVAAWVLPHVSPEVGAALVLAALFLVIALTLAPTRQLASALIVLPVIATWKVLLASLLACLRTIGLLCGRFVPAWRHLRRSRPSTRHQRTGPPVTPTDKLLRTLVQLSLVLAVFWTLLWGGSRVLLWWRGPTVDGSRALAMVAASRSESPALHTILAIFEAGRIYTFDELIAATRAVRAAALSADLSLFVDLVIGLLVATAAIWLLRGLLRWISDPGPPPPIVSQVGVLDDSKAFIPHALPTPQLPRLSPKALTRLSWRRDLTPLTPLASTLLEVYAAAPDWPAASEGQHGDVTLLAHVLGVRTRALSLAEQDGLGPSLAELAALGHDLGKLVTFRRQSGALAGTGPEWNRVSPNHARMSSLLIATLSGWEALSLEDRGDLTIAIAFHHQPDEIPLTTGLRARALLRLLRHADGLATSGERSATSSPITPSEVMLVEPPASPAPEDALTARVAAALEQLLPILRINTRPFDGRADPDVGLLMLLDRNLRSALGPQLSVADQQLLHLNATAPALPEDEIEDPSRHPATSTIATAFHTLGWLIDVYNDTQGLLWDTKIGRRRWRACWLLNLQVMPPTMQARWGRSEWKIEVLGPAWPDHLSDTTAPEPYDAEMPAPLTDPATITDDPSADLSDRELVGITHGPDDTFIVEQQQNPT